MKKYMMLVTFLFTSCIGKFEISFTDDSLKMDLIEMQTIEDEGIVRESTSEYLTHKIGKYLVVPFNIVKTNAENTLRAEFGNPNTVKVEKIQNMHNKKQIDNIITSSYEGIDIKTYNTYERSLLMEIHITKSNIMMDGVTIGSKRRDVEGTFGKSYEFEYAESKVIDNDDVFYYGGMLHSGLVVFKMENNVVKEIFISETIN